MGIRLSSLFSSALICCYLTINVAAQQTDITETPMPDSSNSYEQDVQSEDDKIIDERIKTIQDSILKNPDSAELHYDLSQAYLMKGSIEEAFKSLLTAIEKIPTNQNTPQTPETFTEKDHALYNEAVTFGKKMMIDQALERFNELLERYPNSPDLLLKTAILYGNAGDYPSFFAALYNASSFKTGSPDQERIMGGILFLLGKHDESSEYFAKCIEKNKDYSPAYLWLGKIRLMQKKFDEGLYLINKAVELEPENYTNLVTLGRIYMEMGIFDKSEEALTKAAEINSGYWEAYETLGYLYFYQNEIDKSIAMFKEVIVQRPNNIESLLSLAKVYQQSGQYDEAIKVYKSVIQLAPDAFVLHCDLADLYVMTNDLRMAADSFKRALEIYDESPLAHYRLGIILRKLDDFSGAIRHIKRAIKLKNDFPEAYEALFYIYRDDLKDNKEADYYRMMLQLMKG
ncbi:MAG: tetratricopeptide repeat protein [Candidatus Auribacter fodinae]|jgi:superkiller protein 3|uniref:Tetratricopeptide repeat protein n=1 Tax=Candidatus Auribacter fodinae TaxID=2093366 RepID=A0A3A4R2F0_9BACT|nr:MAG: tetratricopeptide repeat protein [Candidatus Auribacter fodinae]